MSKSTTKDRRNRCDVMAYIKKSRKSYVYMKIIIELCKIFAVILIITTANISSAMQSASYRIAPDVLNETGGYSSSETYALWHNLGEGVVTGETASASYRSHQGFYTTDVPILAMSISEINLDFGLFSISSVSTQNTNLTISTNALTGYSVQSYDNTSAGSANGMLSGSKKIADATTPNNFLDLPTAGTEHYGITVTGTHADSDYVGGTKINSLDNTTWADIGSHTSYVAGDVLTVQYRASISLTTPASDNYQALTTFIVTGNF